jgi:hypothetical protein
LCLCAIILVVNLHCQVCFLITLTLNRINCSRLTRPLRPDYVKRKKACLK